MVLNGIGVVGVGGGHGLAYCGKLFAYFGPTMINLEPPDGVEGG